ncbi:glycerol-3-phosphate responsive antiterminator GlpP [Virgibacillus profundi]|uniref:Glycerol uptake operon antiterminator regulatory protein n=1 Tax=Virgibacillus profundi TaxID=2024555 RepID=A0A2A2I9M7_9BACI|nr:glycerol-3-phosphate responsive antiterminator [Virgibacillus profundi]PAV27763.1 glycerol-3-phosphate responsive antiterminator GlpP [Virgibacillus profundi]PXY51918.1 glycerol-3-phosphate responsive antiterminator [Virgibacillus profundi]
MNIPTGVLPAIRKMKDFERALETSNESIVFLETRLSQLKSLVDYTKRANKKALIHFDLIQGLKADEYGMEFLIREVKPDGILSTRGNVISMAKKHKLLAIQRIFLLDSIALEHNLKLIKRFQPDCVEVLPGLVPSMVEHIRTETNLPVIAGGLIKQEEEVNAAMNAGAVAVSTSNRALWSFK